MRASDIALGAALTEAGLKPLASRAIDGEWNDYFGMHPVPKANLVILLKQEQQRTLNVMERTRIGRVIKRIEEGEFDSTLEEGNEWAASPEGQRAWRELGLG
jgi:hypothetical protein